MHAASGRESSCRHLDIMDVPLLCTPLLRLGWVGSLLAMVWQRWVYIGEEGAVMQAVWADWLVKGGLVWKCQH